MAVVGHFWIALVVFLFWVGVIALGVLLALWLVRSLRSGSSPRSALDILKERFARGEIDQQEYETRKKALEEP